MICKQDFEEYYNRLIDLDEMEEDAKDKQEVSQSASEILMKYRSLCINVIANDSISIRYFLDEGLDMGRSYEEVYEKIMERLR